MIVVKKNGQALKFASEGLQTDREIVMAAVKQYGKALEFASEDLQKDFACLSSLVPIRDSPEQTTKIKGSPSEECQAMVLEEHGGAILAIWPYLERQIWMYIYIYVTVAVERMIIKE